MTVPMCETWTARSLQDRETTTRDRDCVADRASVHRPLDMQLCLTSVNI